MRLFFVMAFIIMMVVTIMTVVMTVPMLQDSEASSAITRVNIALALLLVTSPFMVMGMIEMLWGKAKNPDSKAVGMMTLIVRPFSSKRNFSH